jgi:signal peptidase I
MASQTESGSFLSFLVKLALFVFILRSFIISPFNIPSESMQPRLLIGDYLFVAKWPYGYSRHSLPWSLPLIPGRVLPGEPQRGDVAVFKAPPLNQLDYIKRVIGLPGDTVQMKGGVLYLNGKAVPKQRIDDLVIPVTANMLAATAATGEASPCFRETYEVSQPDGGQSCRYPRFRETLPGGRTYEVLDLAHTPQDDTLVFTVPPGHYFMMGDNRDRSADSRFPAQAGVGVGMVPAENLVGRALVTMFSTDGSAQWLLPWTWLTAARPERIGQGF